MKLQLKRSQVLADNTAGAVVPQPPTSAAMFEGELALNYNAGDPALFIEDAAGNIVRIDGNTQTYSINLDGDELQLIHNGTGTNNPVVIATADLSGFDTSAMDLQGVTDNGKTTTNGADFGGNLTTASDLQCGGNAASGAEDGVRIRPSGFINVSRANGASPVLQGFTTGDSARKVGINANGTADFRDIKLRPAQDETASDLVYVGDLSSGANTGNSVGMVKKPESNGTAGLISYNITDSNSFDVNNSAFSVFSSPDKATGKTPRFITLPSGSTYIGDNLNSISNANISLESDGSARFEGNVTANDATLNRLNLEEGVGTGDITFASYPSAGSNPTCALDKDGLFKLGPSAYLAPTITLTGADGSASFTGNVEVGVQSPVLTSPAIRQFSIDTANAGGVGPELTLQNRGQGTAALNLITSVTKRSEVVGYSGKLAFTQSGNLEFGGKIPQTDPGDLPDTTITFSADGSATFAGNVEIGDPTVGTSAGGTKAWNNGAFYLYTDNALGSSTNFRIYNPDASSATDTIISFTNDGSASFAGNVVAGTKETSRAQLNASAGNFLGQNETTSTFRVDNGGNVDIGGTITGSNSAAAGNAPNIGLKADGSASFASGALKLLNGNNTKAISISTTDTGAKAAIGLYGATNADQARGKIELTAVDTAVLDNAVLFKGGTVSSPENIKLASNGSASFADRVTSVGLTSSGSIIGTRENASDVAFLVRTGDTSKARIDAGGTAYFGGIVDPGQARHAPGIQLNENGSAVFKGDTIVGTTDGSSGTDAGGVYSGKEGYITLFKDSTDTSSHYIQGRQHGMPTNDFKFKIDNDGSATFASNVTTGGNPQTGGEAGVRLWAEGQIDAARTSGSSAVFKGYTVGNSTTTSRINADGSMDVAGTGIKDFYRSTSGNPDDNPNTSLFRLYGNTGAGTGDDRKTQTGAWFANGSIGIGGDPSKLEDSNIALYAADGSASFAGGDTTIAADGAVSVNKDTYGSAFGISQAGTVNAFIQSDGDSYFNQAVKVGNTYAAPNVEILADGSATFAGDITAGNVTFNTGADDPANFDSEGVYTGPTLAVQDKLTDIIDAFSILKTAAAASTDHAELKAAIATALANF